jgi:hypothetical protein
MLISVPCSGPNILAFSVLGNGNVFSDKQGLALNWSGVNSQANYPSAVENLNT